MDIITDTRGQSDLLSKDRLVDSDDDYEFDAEIDITKLGATSKQKEKKEKFDPSNDFDLDEFESDMGWKKTHKKSKYKLQPPSVDLEKLIKEVNPVEEVLKKSNIPSDIEKLDNVPEYDPSDKKLKAGRRREREKTKGKQWFNMPATEMTDEIRHDLEIIQMRSALDPKHFYKKNDKQALPKYFQIGKVLDAPLDFYNSRLTKKERKRTIVDELMADAEFSKYNKRKYKEIISEKAKTHYKAHKRAKKFKAKRK